MGSLKNYAEAFDARLQQVNTVAPKVSVIVTNYNYANYVIDCLQSVGAQDYPAIECVIVDDCSQDGSVERIQNFIANDKSPVAFKLIAHESTKGQYSAFRTGMVHTDGAFVCFLDADDLLLPDFVSEHVRMHLSRPPVAFTSSNQYQIDSTGQVIGGVHPDLCTRSTVRIANTISLHRPFWIWATTSSMMFRRTVLGYVLSNADESFRQCADNYVCHFSNLLGGSILIPAVLGCYRRHQQNTFSTNPLIGGRLPTGDMRNHPTHEAVVRHIEERLLECNQQFIALLGVDGFLHTLARVTPWSGLRRIRGMLQQADGFGGRGSLRLFQFSIWLYFRTIVRTLKKWPPSVSFGDLDHVEQK